MCQSRSWTSWYLPSGDLNRSSSRSASISVGTPARLASESSEGTAMAFRVTFSVLLISSPASTGPGLRTSARVDLQRLDPPRLAVEVERAVEVDRPRPAQVRAADGPLEPDDGPGVVDRVEGGLQGVVVERVVPAERPGRVVADGPRLPFATAAAGNKAARASGSPSPCTTSSSALVSGPPGLTTTTWPSLIAGDEQRHLGPDRRRRGADLAIDRRPGPLDPPDDLRRRAVLRHGQDLLDELQPRLDLDRPRLGASSSFEAASFASGPARNRPSPFSSMTTLVASPTRSDGWSTAGASAARDERTIAQTKVWAIPSSPGLPVRYPNPC